MRGGPFRYLGIKFSNKWAEPPKISNYQNVVITLRSGVCGISNVHFNSPCFFSNHTRKYYMNMFLTDYTDRSKLALC